MKQQQDIKLSLRRATRGDKEDLLVWRNDMDMRCNSFQQKVVTENEHEQWFAKVMQDDNRFLLIGCLGEKKIGVVRYDKIGDKAYEVNINVAPGTRGQGWGTELLKQSLFWVKGKVKARVKKSNAASLRCFLKAGYKIVADEKEIITLENFSE